MECSKGRVTRLPMSMPITPITIFWSCGLRPGAMGIGLFGIFMIWLAFRISKVWRKTLAGASEFDRLLAQAATIAIGLLIAHSLVDYPLRTGAMMAILAFSCALLVEPLVGSEAGMGMPAERGRTEGKRQNGGTILPETSIAAGRSAGSSAVRRGVKEVSSPPRQPGRSWGEGVNWPKEWD